VHGLFQQIWKGNGLLRNQRENNDDAKAGTPSARFEEPVRKAFSNKSISPSSIEIMTVEWALARSVARKQPGIG
jgi:hypothetical protein